MGIEAVGFRQLGDRNVIATGDAEQRIARFDEVNGRRRADGGNSPARRDRNRRR